MSISDRISDFLAWDTLDLAQWYALVGAMVRGGDIEAVPKVLALMAVHGYPSEAEDLRQKILLVSRVEGGESDA